MLGNLISIVGFDILSGILLIQVDRKPAPIGSR